MSPISIPAQPETRAHDPGGTAARCARTPFLPAQACALTVLRARGRRLCKAVLPDGTVLQYDQAKRFDLHARPVAGLSDLERLLERLMRLPGCAVVRGAPADPDRTRGVRRLLHGDGETGELAALREAPRRWLALDMDGPPLPPGVDPRNLAGCAAAVLPLLPSAFRGAAHLIQATASHGLKPGARLRLWFWLDRPFTGPECRRWLADAPVDPSVFTANQPIYTAAPLFPAGGRTTCRAGSSSCPGRPRSRRPRPQASPRERGRPLRIGPGSSPMAAAAP
jgi:hypothetical protein